MLSWRQIALRVLIVFVGGFLLLFAARLGYGYWSQPDGVPLRHSYNAPITGQGLFSFASGVKNYASRKRKAGTTVAVPAGGVADQKYEKVASVALKSRAFDDDEARVRQLISAEDALVQFEQREGLKGQRRLRLVIGVDPARFDGFVEAVQTYGKLTALTINKSDKTNEYRELQAKRLSLEKTRAALQDLKSREGKITDHVALEQRILELEQQIQALGVSLGDFDAENEFVTVKMLLQEVGAQKLRSLSFLRRAFAAFSWASWVYASLCFALACAMFAGFVGVHLVRYGIRVAASAEAGNKT